LPLGICPLVFVFTGSGNGMLIAWYTLCRFCVVYETLT
jgi:hypothetical protein